MKKFLVFLLAMMLVFGIAATASAITIFEDNFDDENGGSGALDYNSFANWTVSGGTVDLIGPGLYDPLPGNGLYVDMDGSTGNAGIMTSSISLEAGDYYLEFDLAGNQRDGESENVNVWTRIVGGGGLSETYSLNRFDPFTHFVETFTVGSTGSIGLSFEGVGGDNIGMLLDNVKISPVPEPATMLLFGSGLMGLAGLRRKFKK